MSTLNMHIYKISRSSKVRYDKRVPMPGLPSLQSSHKMPSRSTKSSAPFLLSPWSNARCKIILSSFNGQSVTGTNTFRVVTTMLSPVEKEPGALRQLLPQHQCLLVLLVPVSAPPALLDVVLPQQQRPQPREEQDRQREVRPRLW